MVAASPAFTSPISGTTLSHSALTAGVKKSSPTVITWDSSATSSSASTVTWKPDDYQSMKGNNRLFYYGQVK